MKRVGSHLDWVGGCDLVMTITSPRNIRFEKSMQSVITLVMTALTEINRKKILWVSITLALSPRNYELAPKRRTSVLFPFECTKSISAILNTKWFIPSSRLHLSINEKKKKQNQNYVARYLSTHHSVWNRVRKQLTDWFRILCTRQTHVRYVTPTIFFFFFDWRLKQSIYCVRSRHNRLTASALFTVC